MNHLPDLYPGQSTRDRCQQLIDTIEVDGIYMLDCSGHVLTWNRGAELNKGYGAEEILGKSFSLFLTPEDVAASVPEQILSEVLRHGDPLLFRFLAKQTLPNKRRILSSGPSLKASLGLGSLIHSRRFAQCGPTPRETT
jgi:PAS domain-containing protein